MTPHPPPRQRERPAILYVGSRLPALSETFVTREVLGLRARGVPVAVASVHAPQRELGDAKLDALADEAVPVYGPGAARMLADAAAEAGRRPFRTLATLAVGLRDAMFGRDVTPAGRPKLVWQCLGGIALARRARPRGVAHIHAHMAHVPASIAMYAARQLGVGFSFTGHAADLFRDRSLLAAKLRRARFAACISRWHRGFYGSIAAVPDERLPLVRCGVEPAEGPAADADVRSILAVGRLVPKKGFDVLLRAVARVRDEGEPVRCTIVGDGPERARLHALAADLCLAHCVEFAGARSNAGVRAMIPAHGLFVLPCRVDERGDRDGIPVVLMEAMAVGVCVVTGDLPSIRELVEHGRTGILIPPGEAEPLAHAILNLLGNPHQRAALAAAGRERVREEFVLDRNLDRLQAAFDAAILTEPPARRASTAPQAARAAATELSATP